KPGDVIGPEKTDRGFELVKVEGFREGDVSLEQATPEIAEEKLRTERAKEKAKQAAEQALAQVKAGKTLTELFPKPTDSDENDPIKRMMAPPAAEETGMFARRGELVPQIGVSSDLLKKAFELKPNEIAGPFEASGAIVIVRLKEHKDPDKDYFTQHKDE